MPLSTAVALLLRERLTGDAPPAGTEPGIDLVRDWIEEAGGADMDALGLVLDDQSAFASLATKLLEGEFKPGDTITVSAESGRLILSAVELFRQTAQHDFRDERG